MTLVNKRTVDNWLSEGRNIPLKKLEVIESLMSEEIVDSETGQPTKEKEEKKEFTIPAQLPHTVQNGMVP